MDPQDHDIGQDDPANPVSPQTARPVMPVRPRMLDVKNYLDHTPCDNEPIIATISETTGGCVKVLAPDEAEEGCMPGEQNKLHYPVYSIQTLEPREVAVLLATTRPALVDKELEPIYRSYGLGEMPTCPEDLQSEVIPVGQIPAAVPGTSATPGASSIPSASATGSASGAPSASSDSGASSAPGTSATRSASSAPATFAGPDASSTPGASYALGAPSTTGASSGPGMSATPGAFYAAGAFPAPGAPSAAGAFPAPGAPSAAGAFPAPGAPSAAGAFPAPGAPSAAGAFSAPDVCSAAGAFAAPGVYSSVDSFLTLDAPPAAGAGAPGVSTTSGASAAAGLFSVYGTYSETSESSTRGTSSEVKPPVPDLIIATDFDLISTVKPDLITVANPAAKPVANEDAEQERGMNERRRISNIMPAYCEAIQHRRARLAANPATKRPWNDDAEDDEPIFQTAYEITARPCLVAKRKLRANLAMNAERYSSSDNSSSPGSSSSEESPRKAKESLLMDEDSDEDSDSVEAPEAAIAAAPMRYTITPTNRAATPAPNAPGLAAASRENLQILQRSYFNPFPQDNAPSAVGAAAAQVSLPAFTSYKKYQCFGPCEVLSEEEDEISEDSDSEYSNPPVLTIDDLTDTEDDDDKVASD